MWKKRIRLWLMSLLLSFSVLTGCSPEIEKLGGELVGEIVDGVIDGVLSELESEETFTSSDILLEETKESEESVEESVEESSEETFEDTEQMTETVTEETTQQETETLIAVDGIYTSKEQVALYLYTYEQLPSNYITKSEARQLGWDSSAGNLWDVADGKSIGGDRFWNNEELLPEENGRKYYECDIDYEGGYRNAKRIIYSNDGFIYYTEDHYKTFEQLYPEP